MARLLELNCKKCNKSFKLISGPIRSDMNLSEQDRAQKTNERQNNFFKELDDHSKECTGNEVVVNKLGFVD